MIVAQLYAEVDREVKRLQHLAEIRSYRDQWGTFRYSEIPALDLVLNDLIFVLAQLATMHFDALPVWGNEAFLSRVQTILAIARSFL